MKSNKAPTYIPLFFSLLVIATGIIQPSTSEITPIPLGRQDFTVSYEVIIQPSDPNPGGSQIELVFFARSLGWVGIGFNDKEPSETMFGADFLIGGLDSSSQKAYLNDYYLPIRGPNRAPVLDNGQSYYLVDANEGLLDGHETTCVHVRRWLNTWDSADVIIENKNITFLWAYNSETDDPTKQHTQMGIVPSINFLKIPATSSPSMRPSPCRGLRAISGANSSSSWASRSLLLFSFITCLAIIGLKNGPH